MIKKIFSILVLIVLSTPVLASIGYINDDVINSSGLQTFAPLAGRVFYVDSTNLQSGGYTTGSYQTPYDTLAHCMSRANLVTGDVVIVKPFHVEALSSNLVISDSGIKIIGLGDYYSMPKLITYTGVYNTISITGSGVEISGIKFLAGVDSQNVLLSNKGSNNSIKNCAFVGSASIQPVTFVSTNVTIDFIGNFMESMTAGCVDGLTIISTPDRCRISDNLIVGDFSTSAIEATGAETNGIFSQNTIINTNGSGKAIKLASSATGMINDNRIQIANSTYTNALVPASASYMENYVSTGNAGRKNVPMYWAQ